MTFGDVIGRYSHEVSGRTSQRWRHNVTRWLKFGGEGKPASITTESFEAWRDVVRPLVASGDLSPTTVEDTISDVRTLIAREFGTAPGRGRSLRKRTQVKRVPTLDELGRAWKAAGSLNDVWPTAWVPALRKVESSAFWRAWLVVSYWTGLRLGDLMELRWRDVGEDRITTTSSKTGKLHSFPMIDRLQESLNPIRTSDERVFPVPAWGHNRIRRELRRLDPNLTPQALRRLSITEWTVADPEAGRIVHGTSLDVVNRHYLDGLRVLERASTRVSWPDVLAPSTLERRRHLMSVLKRIPDEKVDALLQVAGSMR